LLDSFTPRGVREICTQKVRVVSEARDRPEDAHAALRWLAARADVRAADVALMGWSNGGSTVLHTLDERGPERASPLRFRAAVAFYPGCGNRTLAGFRPAVPLLIQAGGADDWTPARHCIALAKSAAAQGAAVSIDVYPGAHHAFDRLPAGIHHRPDVRNAASATGLGATIGAHPEARAQARQRTFDFLFGPR
jgi:dienelactone hydrolase